MGGSNGRLEWNGRMEWSNGTGGSNGKALPRPRMAREAPSAISTDGGGFDFHRYPWFSFWGVDELKRSNGMVEWNGRMEWSNGMVEWNGRLEWEASAGLGGLGARRGRDTCPKRPLHGLRGKMASHHLRAPRAHPACVPACPRASPRIPEHVPRVACPTSSRACPAPPSHRTASHIAPSHRTVTTSRWQTRNAFFFTWSRAPRQPRYLISCDEKIGERPTHFFINVQRIGTSPHPFFGSQIDPREQQKFNGACEFRKGLFRETRGDLLPNFPRGF